MEQFTLHPTSGEIPLAPAQQHTGFAALLSTHSSRTLKERAALEYQRNTYAAMLTGSAIQYTGALCALERQIYEDNPYSGDFCRALLGAYVAAYAQQILRFDEK